MPLDSGGSGGGGGDASLDNTDASVDEQQQQQDAREQRRELRRDADSDPMREQTETEEVQTGDGPRRTTGGSSGPMESGKTTPNSGSSGTSEKTNGSASPPQDGGSGGTGQIDTGSTGGTSGGGSGNTTGGGALDPTGGSPMDSPDTPPGGGGGPTPPDDTPPGTETGAPPTDSPPGQNQGMIDPDDPPPMGPGDTPPETNQEDSPTGEPPADNGSTGQGGNGTTGQSDSGTSGQSTPGFWSEDDSQQQNPDSWDNFTHSEREMGRDYAEENAGVETSDIADVEKQPDGEYTITFTKEEQKEQVAESFLADNPAYDREDIAGVTLSEEGKPSISFTDSGTETYIGQNYEPGVTTGEAPDSGGPLREAMGPDQTTAFNQGAEAGSGKVAEKAQGIENDILEENPGLTADDVAVNLNDDGSFSPELTESGQRDYREQQLNNIEDVLGGASGTLSDNAAENPPENATDMFEQGDGPKPESGTVVRTGDLEEGENSDGAGPTEEAVEELERRDGTQSDTTLEDVDEIGGDATTYADRELQEAERVHNVVEQQIQNQGFNPENTDIAVAEGEIPSQAPGEIGGDATTYADRELQAAEQQERMNVDGSVSVDGYDVSVSESQSVQGNPYPAALDVLAGSTDEAVGRAVVSAKEGDIAGVGDALAGSTDEAYGRIQVAHRRGDYAGKLDHLAGGFDEAVGRATRGEGTSVAYSFDPARRAGLLLSPYAAETKRQLAAGENSADFSRVADAYTNPNLKAEQKAGVVFDEALGPIDESFAGGYDADTVSDVTQDADTGYLDEEEEATLNEASRRFGQDVSNVGESVQQNIDYVVPGEGPSAKGKLAEGVVQTARAGNVFAAAGAAETGIEIAANTNGENYEEVIQSGAAVGQQIPGALATQARQKPFETAGEFIGGAAAGSVAFKALDKVGDGARAARLAGKDTVDYEDITSERGVEGELPYFDTNPSADTSKAIKEIKEKAADNPESVTSKTGGERTLYHGTGDKFGDDVEVGEAASELPGLFTSPDASPIALEDVGSTSGRTSFKPSLPSLTGRSDRFLGLPGDRVDRIPEGQRGQGYALRSTDADGQPVATGLGRPEAKRAAAGRDDVDVAPDPTTSGYRFLTEDADPGTAYAKPTSTRSRELEAVFSPGSTFEKTGQVAVRVGRKQVPGTDVDIPLSGRKVPLDTYRRSEVEADSQQTDIGPGDLPGAKPGDTGEYEVLVGETRRLSRRGSPAQGGAIAGSPAGVLGPSSTAMGESATSPPVATEPLGSTTRPSGSPGRDSSPAAIDDPGTTTLDDDMSSSRRYRSGQSSRPTSSVSAVSGGPTTTSLLPQESSGSATVPSSGTSGPMSSSSPTSPIEPSGGGSTPPSSGAPTGPTSPPVSSPSSSISSGPGSPFPPSTSTIGGGSGRSPSATGPPTSQEPDPDDRKKKDEPVQEEWGGWARRRDRSLLNPFTGE